MSQNALRLIACFGLIVTLGARIAPADEPKGEKKADEAPVAGIGVALRIEDRRVLVNKVLPNSPAEQSGQLRPGDRIVAIAEAKGEPKEVTGRSMEEVTGLIRGAPGTVVRLTVVPAGADDTKSQVISLARGEVKELNLFGRGKPLSAGTVAPEIEFTRLFDGKKRKLSDYRGRIVVVEFWACWCKPCLEQLDGIPKVIAEHPEWTDKVVILAVSVDDAEEDPAALARRREWKGVEAVWSGPPPLKPYHATALPTRYVIDREGKVTDSPRETPLAEAIEACLKAAK